VDGPPREVGGARREPPVALQEVCSYCLPGRPGIENCRCVVFNLFNQMSLLGVSDLLG